MDHLYLLREALRAVQTNDISQANGYWKKVIESKPGYPSQNWCEDLCQDYFETTCQKMQEYIQQVRHIRKIDISQPDWLPAFDDFSIITPSLDKFMKHAATAMVNSFDYSDITDLRKLKRKKTVEINRVKSTGERIHLSFENVDYPFLIYRITEIPLLSKHIKIYKVKNKWFEKLKLTFVFSSNRLKREVVYTNF